LNEGEIVEFKVYRFTPSVDKSFYYIIYEVPYRPGMTVLDGLTYILEELDPSLSFRYSCRFKICGSCAIRINSEQKLACESQVSNLGKEIQIDPLSNFRIIKDLVVDIEPFLRKMSSVMPFLHPKAGSEIPRVAPEEFRKYKSPSDCIWCAACFSACPIAGTEPYFLGPAALSQLYRFMVDTREREDMKPLRLIIADSGVSGIWLCHQIYACASVCPKNIKSGSLIAHLKRMVVKARFTGKM
jgi:succinate dehydrogenase / fumarate reductase iron-sulfur subunit